MDEYQKYKVQGMVTDSDADVIQRALEEAGYYQCVANAEDSTLIIPISFAGYIDDIEKIIFSLGYEFDDDD